MTIFVPASYPSAYAADAVRDYPTLQTAIQNWFARSDIGAYVDYFIQVAEERIYRDIFTMNQGAGVRPLETSISTAINAAGVVPLPPGYVGMHHLLVSVDNCTFELVRKNPEFIYTNHPFRAAGGTPQYFAREGSNIIFGPFPDSEYAITGIYWQRFPPLSSTNPTTWMTQLAPLLLLQACNAAVAGFLKDAQTISFWEGEYTRTMQAFLLADRAEELSGSSLSMTAA
jgi:hypothetical protein